MDLRKTRAHFFDEYARIHANAIHLPTEVSNNVLINLLFPYTSIGMKSTLMLLVGAGRFNIEPGSLCDAEETL